MPRSKQRDSALANYRLLVGQIYSSLLRVVGVDKWRHRFHGEADLEDHQHRSRVMACGSDASTRAMLRFTIDCALVKGRHHA
ncbi:hypothetical protein L6654_41885 [Bradyrhizobium sp. WYCCWR 13023]|uniref:Uncharacterized protein n=1 Tax=Bradyrhizobium zhengyangense TaxID=2911009 RepID=A0A9X1RI11_9BRAD|nr:hypothetical protein [Bradyrhizobium zhengyangense]MCG2633096.1 hypothetical protein [Bradyrhizobium zhengyangense]